ncbi:MAG: 16S rRNA (adenine(1518)-N(6)/adenine(1519)-N(6))-dimethyltransferase RsmA [Spirochaetaceae bacterium]|nr:16S rRNA (adenine(1518)-N(6)/adenine(1519)-N(6))-dimethyltransferase RsmA [Spirochaetaceae bacterium]
MSNIPNIVHYDSPAALKKFLEERGLGMQKKFGQNFLINPSARNHLVDALQIKEDDDVWEIGAGLGAMSALLLKRGARVCAFEIDRGFCSVLKEIFSDETKFTLIEGDVFERWRLCPTEGRPLKLFGNLPYNIGAKLLGDFAENNFFFSRIVVTVQREVARRIAAKKSSEDYSSLSVLLACFYHTKLLSVLKGESFFPVPHVESQGISLELKENITPPPLCFVPLVRTLFSSRRKTIKNNLGVFLKRQDITHDPVEILRQCEIAPEERAENLSPEDFLSLAKCVSRVMGERV